MRQGSLIAVLVLAGCSPNSGPRYSQDIRPLAAPKKVPMEGKIQKSDADWRKALDKQTYEVMREHGTERPFTGRYVDNHEDGHYICAACGYELFDSKNKFDSGTGWPSFDAPMKKEAVAESVDESYGMKRVEVHCPRCGGHLGHVFEDGPETTGMRYCINSCSLKFKKR